MEAKSRNAEVKFFLSRQLETPGKQPNRRRKEKAG
jgi:hypothetical protein